MKIYRMSANALETLTDIAELPPSSVRELSDFLASNLEGLTGPEGALQLTKKGLKKVKPELAFRWLNALVPFIFEVVSNSQDSLEVVNDLVANAQRQLLEGENKTELSASVAKKMQANLLALFDNPKTRLKAKSLRLLNSQARKLTDCEIMSDIRPVFQTDGEIVIEAAVMYHTLRLGHTATGENFFISLDSQDLKKLEKVIKRAIAKEAALSRLIEKTGVEEVKVS